MTTHELVLSHITSKPKKREYSKWFAFWFAFWKAMFRYRELWLALLVLGVIVGAVNFASWLSPHDPSGPMNLSNRLASPFWLEGGSMVHPLGTDNLGRDVLSRTLHGGQISLQIAFISGTLATFIGLVFGLVSGYVGGKLNMLMMALTDLWLAFPFLVLALAVIAAVGKSLTILIVLLTLAGWVHSARVTNAQTIVLRQHGYVEAAVAAGASHFHIVVRHILPGVVNANIVMWAFSVGTLILIEGSLSFIGMGVSGNMPSWGNMLGDGRDYLRDAWWMSIFPGLALMLTVLAVNNLGDALQKLHNRQT